jgi:hypothetical protein
MQQRRSGPSVEGHPRPGEVAFSPDSKKKNLGKK